MPFRPFKPATHLKPYDPNRPWEDRSPALCGEQDKGTFFFLSAANQREIDALFEASKGKPFPLCVDCGIQAERGFEAQQ